MDIGFWIVYGLAAAAAFYHSFIVFSLSDPWPIAALSAGAIDFFLAWTMNQLGRITKRNRAANLLGVGLFALVSGMAQVIARYHGMGQELPYWLGIVSLGLVPVSTTGALVMLGIIKYFANDDVGNEIRERVDTVVEQVKDAVETVKRGPGRPRKEVYASESTPSPKVSKTHK